MQGHRSSVSALPENLSFDHGSTSTDAGIDSQVPWNSMQTSVQNRLPEYRISSSENNIQYLQHVRPEGRNAEWSLGETSSSAAQHHGDENERKTEHTWTYCSRALEEQQYEPPNNLSPDNVDDLNMSFEDQEDDECQVVERPSGYISIGSSNDQMRSTGSTSDSCSMSSGCGGYMMEDSEDRPGCSLDGRRMSCKRKALEVHGGQSSGVGSSNCFQNTERSQWHTIPPAQVASGSISMPMPTENDPVINNGSEQENPRLRLGVGGAASASPFSLTASGNAESSRRNFRLRIHGLHQEDPIPDNPFPTEAHVGNVDVSSSRHSSR
ncbi:E3 ubiquitin-protein ligase MBR2 [Sesamum angolense]|uniref:E3 ubiquitin-protein ligase MBR2 n=1 Tax=Sesamum angolense TaxID=2727404 RepID=A0AAE1T488_9LAMI|nr:E3 ubiquitin-protein ligase MBR2 [Sesamum angolense]